MTKYIKPIFLTVTLCTPILIFLFLKFFGENRYDIPVYYQKGVSTQFEVCNSSEGQFYVTTDTSLPSLFLFLNPSKTFGLSAVGNIKQRLQEDIDGIGLMIFSNDSILRENEGVKYLDASAWLKQMHCNFVTDTVNQFILVDSKKQIRGYYNTDREEVDRLIVETKILLENERNNN